MAGTYRYARRSAGQLQLVGVHTACGQSGLAGMQALERLGVGAVVGVASPDARDPIGLQHRPAQGLGELAAVPAASAGRGADRDVDELVKERLLDVAAAD